jgi:hypothetical protein
MITEVAEDFPASIFKVVKAEWDFPEDRGRKLFRNSGKSTQ